MSTGSRPAEGEALVVQGLTREFRSRRKGVVRALDQVSFTAQAGETVGLLGPNGAGKTTLSRILTTLLVPTQGTARVAGFDVATQARQVREQIGLVLGGERGLYRKLTARQNLVYWAALQGLGSRAGRARAEELIERLGLSDRADDRLETYSRGMVQRVHLARALLHDPAVLILDEPTAGMDPHATSSFRSLVGELQAAGTTILLATHDMAEAQAVCTRVALIDRGRLLRIDTPGELLGELSELHVITAAQVSPSLVESLPLLPGVNECHCSSDGSVRLEVRGDDAATGVLLALTQGHAQQIGMAAPGLGEVYRSVIQDRELTV